MVEQNSTKHRPLGSPVSLSSTGLLQRTGHGGCKGNHENMDLLGGKVDYAIPNFQLTRNQAESLAWVRVENLSEQA